jgi:hypothetical protein
LPVAALPFNDIKITYDFRDWTELVMVIPAVGSATPTVRNVVPYVNGEPAAAGTQPTLTNVETYAHYAIVHNDERVKMGDAPRDILIHQIQETQVAPFQNVTAGRQSFDLRLSHAIVVFTWKAQNVSLQRNYQGLYGTDQSNYTTLSSVFLNDQDFAVDPIAFTTLFYENSVRLANASDYFSLTHAWFFSEGGSPATAPGAIAEYTGYHIYSYALKPWDPTRPSGSTDYSKLANVSLAHDPSQAAQNAAADPATFPNGVDSLPAFGPTEAGGFYQSWQHVFAARNWNIFRVANGSAGFPAL